MKGEKELRVVIDTNVLISSIFWEGGAPHEVILLAIDRKIENFTSPEILREIEKVLKEKFGQPDEMVERQVRLIAGYSEIIIPNMRINVVEDPKDNMILECAECGEVDFIVTGDQHLLKLKRYKCIGIINSRECVERVG
jgi:uncharacterized protein